MKILEFLSCQFGWTKNAEKQKNPKRIMSLMFVKNRLNTNIAQARTKTDAKMAPD